MERAARVIGSSKITNKILTGDETARAVWPATVGRVIAAHTSRMRMVRTTLVVEVEDATWQKQLFALRGQILTRLQRTTGNSAITDIEFRVGLPRREPQKSSEPRSPLFAGADAADEADEIQDAVLKKVYRLSRKKATA